MQVCNLVVGISATVAFVPLQLIARGLLKRVVKNVNAKNNSVTQYTIYSRIKAHRHDDQDRHMW